MLSLLLLGVVITFAVSVFTLLKGDARFRPLVLTLITSLVLVFFADKFSGEGSNTSVSWISFAVLMGSVVVSHFIQNRLVSSVAVSFLPFLLYMVSGAFEIGEYSVSPASVMSVCLVIVGFWILPLAGYLAQFFRKLFSTTEDLALPVAFAFLGATLFFAYFFQSLAGVFFLTLGLAMEAVYNRQRDPGLLMLTLSLLIAFTFSSQFGLEEVDLLLGKNLLGLFTGLGIAGIIQFMYRNSKLPVWLMSLFGLSIALFLFLFLGTQKNDLGGMDAYLAALLGASLYGAIQPSGYLSPVILLAAFSPGLFFMIQFPVDHEETLKTEGSASLSAKKEAIIAEVDPFDSTGLSMAMLDGSFNIVKENAQLTFELGPKGGRTKGAFKEVKGVVQIGNKGQELKLYVELPVSGLSTFNRFRDESLMEAEYFNAAKYPLMSFQSSSYDLKEDVLELKGAFTMLGKRVDQLVELKYVGSELRDGVECPVLIGRGSVDRTLFGMRPDPKEGNVVDFKFRILLKKQ